MPRISEEKIRTAEFVSPKHPDKQCDYIADTILDAYLAGDPNSRVAIEVMGGHGVITVSGEVTSIANIDIAKIVNGIVGESFELRINLSPQSEEIAQGVDIGGAGDQGIMVGFATSETENMMPKEYDLARSLCRKIYAQYPYDGKVQVTLNGATIETVVASFQNTNSAELENLVRTFINAENYLINPAGEWNIGGFDADSGLSGRKIIIDNYGPQVSVGGGSFSGKDFTKVDRSGAYMARYLAVQLLKEKNAKEVYVKLAYAIGKPQPVMAVAFVDGEQIDLQGKYDLSPKAIREKLKLREIKYAPLAQWGHFGRDN